MEITSQNKEIQVAAEKVFYQKVEITTTGDVKEYSVRLDDNFNFCTGITLEDPSAFLENRLFAIKSKGSFVLDKIPFSLIDGRELYDFKEKFLKVNFTAKGNLVKFFIDNAGSGNHTYSFILLLTNQKSDFVTPRYDYNSFSIAAASSVKGFFLFNEKETIKKIAFFTTEQTYKLKINVFDDSRTYLKELISVYLHDNRKNDVNNRFFKCWMPPNSLQYNLENLGAGIQNVFVVFEYER